MHLLFLYPFSKAAWFSHPWYFRSEVSAATHRSIPDMINFILSSGHHFASLENVYTFMWCLWKARNDTLFGRKVHKPSQVFAATQAILQGAKLDDQAQSSFSQICNQQHQEHDRRPSPSLQDRQTGQEATDAPGTTIATPFSSPGTKSLWMLHGSKIRDKSTLLCQLG